jgi:Ferritin-like domain
MTMNRRRFLAGTAGATTVALGGPWLASAGAATDDELAFANFGVSAELLLADFYGRALGTKVFSGQQASTLQRGRVAAGQHATALGALLVGAGQAAPGKDDFAFEWPKDAFSSAPAIAATGQTVLRSLLGAYQTAVASVSDPSFRILYASLIASVGQQASALAAISGRAGAEPFPVAVELETASAALEGYLG